MGQAVKLAGAATKKKKSAGLGMAVDLKAAGPLTAADLQSLQVAKVGVRGGGGGVAEMPCKVMCWLVLVAAAAASGGGVRFYASTSGWAGRE